MEAYRHPMPEHIAKRVRELKMGLNGNRYHSARGLAEVICNEFPDYIEAAYGPEAHTELSGNQLLGNDLCREAEAYFGFESWSID